MFSDLVESVAAKKKTNRTWVILASAALQSAGLLALILVPLVYTHALPAFIWAKTPEIPYLAQTPIHLAQAQPTGRRAITNDSPGARLAFQNLRMNPASRGGRIDLRDSLSSNPEDIGPVGPAIFASGPGNGPSPASPAGPAGPAAPPAPVKRIHRIEQGGVVEAAKIISRPDPVYPDWLRRAGIQGEVVLQAIISADGHVIELQMASGNPMLAQAALDAVKQWRYQPTLLNGQPVEVETTITVDFVLGR